MKKQTTTISTCIDSNLFFINFKISKGTKNFKMINIKLLGIYNPASGRVCLDGIKN